jgi:LytS/YehU family sensor histidine kinase
MVSVWVPSLIMQPLIENAVVHGLAGHQGPVVVRVSIRSTHPMLTLRVSNTIAADKRADQEGIGISNVRERLAVQFEGRASLAAGPHGSEWVSEITLPALIDSPEPRAVRRPDLSCA